MSGCLTNIHKPECQARCRETGGCDGAAGRYCAANPADPFCSCINSPLAKLDINPKCNDSACVASGYLNSAMRAASCPDANDCDIQAKMFASGAKLVGVTANPNCNRAPAGAQTAHAPLAISAAPTVAVSSPTLFSPIFLILIFVILLAVVSAAVYFIFFDDDLPHV